MVFQISLKNTLLVALAVTAVGCAKDQGYKISETDPLEYSTQIGPDGKRYSTKLSAKEMVHFGFDKYELSAEDKQMVKLYAERMKKDTDLKLRISGHTDTIGSREYNIGLGQRRADAVKQALVDMGISANRLSVISYGKEQPIALGESEEDMALNRRAAMDYEK